MPKQLFLVRHAKSDWSNHTLSDFDRPLNARGTRDAPVMAQLMVSLGHQPDLMVTSPAVRAQTTAQVFAAAFGVSDAALMRNAQIYESTVGTMLRIIHNLPDEAETVYLFGHNFTFSELAAQFTSRSIDEMPTCAVVQIKSEVARWKDFEYPDAQFERMWKPKDE
jgi:phosphohistidine phosphatase